MLKYRVLTLPVAVALAALGVLAGPTEANADAERLPKCVGVKVGRGEYRLFLDPGKVVEGEVLTVRSGQTFWIPRRDGSWVSQQAPTARRDFHVVIKSDAALFSERRWSSWVTCGPVKVR